MTLLRCAACFPLSDLAALLACFHLACLGCMLGMPADRLSSTHMLLVPADTWARSPTWCLCSAHLVASFVLCGIPLLVIHQAVDEPLAIHTFITAYCLPVATDSPLLQVSLTVLAGKCRFAFAYGYYQDPLVQGLNPLRGPRYGSFPLQVHLQDQVVLLQDAVSRVGQPSAPPARCTWLLLAWAAPLLLLYRSRGHSLSCKLCALCVLSSHSQSASVHNSAATT